MCEAQIMAASIIYLLTALREKEAEIERLQARVSELEGGTAADQ